MISKFFRYELRTTDMEAARKFYSRVVGPQLWNSEIRIVPLPERAAAQGAPPHWLGHIGVTDFELMTARILASGAQQLGPLQEASDGTVQAILRDPFGAVMAMSSEAVPTSSDEQGAKAHSRVVWHVHHSHDHERSFAWYAALLGWNAAGKIDLGQQLGSHQLFTWSDSGQAVGSMANTARFPGVHPQWLFFFRVLDIESALASVRDLGGKVLGPMRTSTGDIVAPCDDPQGGAFALYEFTPTKKVHS